MAKAVYDTRLIPWLAVNEGKVNRWYLDPINVPTIGMGFTWRSSAFRAWWQANRPGVKFARGVTMTDAEIYAVKQLLIDKEYGPPVWRYFANASVTPHAMSTAMDMSFNAGTGSLKWSWARLLREGNVAAAAARFRNTATTAAGRTLAGLVRRRKEGAAIMQHNRWPSYVKQTGKTVTVEQAVKAAPTWKLDDDDYKHAADWLKTLGFWKPAAPHTVSMLRKSKDFKAAVATFQHKHASLEVDGVLGRATRDQIQRVMDLRSKAAKQGGGAVAVSGAGGATQSTGTDLSQPVSIVSDIALWGGLAALVIIGGLLAWKYKDEILLALPQRKPK